MAPDLQQRAHVVQGALHVVADAADGAGRGEGDGKDSLEPGGGRGGASGGAKARRCHGGGFGGAA
jgi:hypothetical protein